MQLLQLVAILCCLATGFAVPTATIKWCVISDPEEQKCNELARRSPAFVCVRKENAASCITAIKDGAADAITLSGEYIFKAGLINNDLVPIIAEDYRSDNSEACSYSVAVAKKGTVFGLKDLRGRKSCHTGLGTSEGWILPIGTLISKGWITWEGGDDIRLLQAVSGFFGESCVPGANDHPNLCQGCKGGCSLSSANDYYGNAGAFKCLAEDGGQVAFMNPAEIPATERNNYELLCQDNTRTAVENYKICNLGQQPAHAVVTRKDKELADNIWTSLSSVRGINLYSSESYVGKDLLFSDSTVQLRQVPQGTDSFLYLGAQYTSKLQSLFREQPQTARTTSIRWCAVGPETTKCDSWSINSFNPITGVSAIDCQSAPTVEECFKKIMRDEADAIAVDGGQVYTAGKCGLVPAMVEQYDEGKCSSSGQTSASSYYAVAVIKKGSGLTWANLKGKRSCHTGMGRTAGWNIPMGLIHKATNDCDFSKFFSSGCAPGAQLNSSFCRNCKGSIKTVGDEGKCSPSTDEQYYGYAGAFRCLVEGAGDVAFIKHTIVGENANANGPEWARVMSREDFELICPGTEGSVPIDQYETCKLAVVPAHAVMTRPDIRTEVVNILKEQQANFGLNGINDKFRMFQSEDGKNLLFKDSTKCLQETQTDSYEQFLGQDYMTAMQSLRQCSESATDLEKSCTFQPCQ